MRIDATDQPYLYYVIAFEDNKNEIEWLYGKNGDDWLFGVTEKPLAIPKVKAQEIAFKLSLKYGTHFMCVETIYPIGE